MWEAVFDNAHPVAIEVGPGRGDFLMAHARTHPAQNILGIERSPNRARAIQERLDAVRLRNARVLNADAPCVVTALPGLCVAAYHIQFPDPWWKRRHHRRRLFTAQFVGSLRRTLVPGGTIELVTDVADYWALAQHLLDAEPGHERITAGETSDVVTTFARKAERRGVPLYRSTHRRV